MSVCPPCARHREASAPRNWCGGAPAWPTTAAFCHFWFCPRPTRQKVSTKPHQEHFCQAAAFNQHLWQMGPGFTVINGVLRGVLGTAEYLLSVQRLQNPLLSFVRRYKMHHPDERLFTNPLLPTDLYQQSFKQLTI